MTLSIMILGFNDADCSLCWVSFIFLCLVLSCWMVFWWMTQCWKTSMLNVVIWSGIALLVKRFPKNKRSSLSAKNCHGNKIKKFYKIVVKISWRQICIFSSNLLQHKLHSEVIKWGGGGQGAVMERGKLRNLKFWVFVFVAKKQIYVFEF